MQTSGATSSTEQQTTAGQASSENDGLSDVVNDPNATQSSNQPVSGASQQHQLRSSTTPPNQQQQQPQQLQYQQSVGQDLGGGGGGGHRQSSGYHNQRHAQQQPNYHHQTNMQQYHHHNKYNNINNNNNNNPRGGDSESNVNHVLLITVINPHYTITCDLIHQICSTYGKVNRIVIFKKNGVQAMVEFDNVESAKRAKSMLYGCDIYSGCCTLRIEYAKPTRLNVHKNDNDSFDYTNPNLSSGGLENQTGAGIWPPNEHHLQQQQQQQQQLTSAAVGGHNQSHGSHHHPRGNRVGAGIGSNSGGNQHHHYHPAHHHHHHGQQQGPVPPVTAAGGHHGSSNYGGVVQPLNQTPPPTNDGFHHDAGFGVTRAGPPYVGVDSYMGPAHGGGPHGNHMYPRQDNHRQAQQHHHHHHHHQQQHHSRSSNGPNHNTSFSSANTSTVMAGHSGLGPPQGTVMMVYGLQPERVNCDRLFNLFCLYGNVVRVKFLRTKEGCAMVQMGDVLAVDRCVSSLNKITLFGSELQISYSKQAFLHDVIQPSVLPDGSPSFKDFMGNKNNRFKNPEVANKNRILPPSQVLHFFNAPYGITEDELVHLFKQTAGHEPVVVKIFPPKADNSKSFAGLVTFKDSAEATEALVLCNHLNMPKPGAPHPYILRLCFSHPSYRTHNYNQTAITSAAAVATVVGGNQ